MRGAMLVAALITLLAGGANAQAPVAEWLFDQDVADWAATDPAANISSTTDAIVVREEDNGVLQLSYTPAAGAIPGVVGQNPAGLAGGQSLHTHLRTTDQTIIMLVLAEADGSSYNAGFTSLADRWQEIALDFGEFQLGDDSDDENGQLDPDQVQSIMVADAVAMLAMLAEQVPFIIAPDLSPRVMWLDDMWIDTEGVEPRWVEMDIDGEEAVQVDSFESAPLQWAMLAGKGIEAVYDPEQQVDGDFSLQITYELPPQKAFAVMTSLQGIPLEESAVFSFSYTSQVATTLLLEIKELDESKYHAMVPLVATDEFEVCEVALIEMTLADDSTDENETLDMAGAKELVIADVSAMTETPVTLNTIRLDDVRFLR